MPIQHSVHRLTCLSSHLPASIPTHFRPRWDHGSFPRTLQTPALLNLEVEEGCVISTLLLPVGNTSEKAPGELFQGRKWQVLTARTCPAPALTGGSTSDPHWLVRGWAGPATEAVSPGSREAACTPSPVPSPPQAPT